MSLSATVLISEKFVISVSCNNERHQLFQLCFYKKDGSIFINFPYQPVDSSYLNRITLKANIEYPHNISFKENGKVTKHKIKFSHHPDGRAHFSQHKKIYTNIINNAVALTDHNGHLFTIHIGGINKFQQISKELSNINNKKTFYYIEIPAFSNLKFIGYWFSDSYLKTYLKEYNFEGGPNAVFKREGESDLKGILIENTYLSKEENYYMFLGCEIDQHLTIKDKPSIVFLGGFENRTTSLNHQKDTSYLTLVYPANKDYEKLVKEIGTVDIEPDIKFPH